MIHVRLYCRVSHLQVACSQCTLRQYSYMRMLQIIAHKGGNEIFSGEQGIPLRNFRQPDHHTKEGVPWSSSRAQAPLC